MLKATPPDADLQRLADPTDYAAKDVTIERPAGARRPYGVLSAQGALAELVKLRGLARGVAAGNPACQPTALLPVRSLSRGLATHWRFCRYLLALTLERIERDEGVGLADAGFKQQIVRATVELLDIEIGQARPLRHLEVVGLRNRLRQRCADHRPIGQRACRRRLADRDLCLVALALDGLDEEAIEDDYAVACVYCAWQPDTRPRLTRDSAARIHPVADFWRREWQTAEVGPPEFEANKSKPAFECPECGSERWKLRRGRDNVPWIPAREDIGKPRTPLHLRCRDCDRRAPLV